MSALKGSSDSKHWAGHSSHQKQNDCDDDHKKRSCKPEQCSPKRECSPKKCSPKRKECSPKRKDCKDDKGCGTGGMHWSWKMCLIVGGIVLIGLVLLCAWLWKRPSGKVHHHKDHAGRRRMLQLLASRERALHAAQRRRMEAEAAMRESQQDSVLAKEKYDAAETRWRMSMSQSAAQQSECMATLKAAEAELQAANQRFGEVQAGSAGVTERLRAEQAEIVALRSKLSAEDAALSSCRTDLAANQARSALLERDLAAASSSYDGCKTELGRTQARDAAERERLQVEKTRLTAAEREAQAANRRLSREVAEAQAATNRLSGQVANLRRSTTNVVSATADVKGEVADIEPAAEESESTEAAITEAANVNAAIADAATVSLGDLPPLPPLNLPSSVGAPPPLLSEALGAGDLAPPTFMSGGSYGRGYGYNGAAAYDSRRRGAYGL